MWKLQFLVVLMVNGYSVQVPAGVLLQTLQRVNFNVFDPKLTRGVCGVTPLWMQLLIKWHAVRGTF